MPSRHSDIPIFNSRDTRFKSPYGAVPAGTPVTLTLRPHHGDGYTYGLVEVYLEFWNNHKIELTMPLVRIEDERDVFSTILDIGNYVGLVWYKLSLFGPEGRYLDLGTHQLTVYDGSETVPDWFGQGMTYQIFPDRFRRTCIPNTAGMVGGRVVHKDWDEEPVYRPNEYGEIRNRDFFGGNFTHK